MFKQIATLFRGRSYEAAEAVVDRNAMAILRQQLRAGQADAARAAGDDGGLPVYPQIHERPPIVLGQVRLRRLPSAMI